MKLQTANILRNYTWLQTKVNKYLWKRLLNFFFNLFFSIIADVHCTHIDNVKSKLLGMYSPTNMAVQQYIFVQ